MEEEETPNKAKRKRKSQGSGKFSVALTGRIVRLLFLFLFFTSAICR